MVQDPRLVETKGPGKALQRSLTSESNSRPRLVLPVKLLSFERIAQDRLCSTTTAVP